VPSGFEEEGVVGNAAQMAHDLTVQETIAAVSQSAILDMFAADGQSANVTPLQPFDVVHPSFSFSDALPANTVTDESLALSHKRGHSVAFEEGRPSATLISTREHCQMTERKRINITTKTANLPGAPSSFQFEAQPTQHSAIPIKGKGSKKEAVPLVQPDRRFTRSQAKLKGFKAPTVPGILVSRPKKKSRKIFPPSASQAPNSPEP
jgi:hypothetical protein